MIVRVLNIKVSEPIINIKLTTGKLKDRKKKISNNQIIKQLVWQKSITFSQPIGYIKLKFLILCNIQKLEY